jgi:hypothetical protein
MHHIPFHRKTMNMVMVFAATMEVDFSILTDKDGLVVTSGYLAVVPAKP